ncbi:hypothetical protein D3C75_1072790 [compost metagenome]
MAAGTHRIIGTAQVAQVVQRRHQPGPGQGELVLSNHQRHLRGKGKPANPHRHDQSNKTTQGYF